MSISQFVVVAFLAVVFGFLAWILVRATRRK